MAVPVCLAYGMASDVPRSPRTLPKVLSQAKARALLGEHGWSRTLGGKHNVKMEKPGALRPITLPHHHGRDYGRDLTESILRQAGLKGADERGEE